jgi:large subunit ribosomal protein L29
MDINEVRALSDADLAAQLVDAKQELWKIRFDLATRQEKNYSKLPATRKRIARILTVMTERRHAQDDGLVDAPAPAAASTDGSDAIAAADGAEPAEAVEASKPSRRRRAKKASENDDAAVADTEEAT